MPMIDEKGTRTMFMQFKSLKVKLQFVYARALGQYRQCDQNYEEAPGPNTWDRLIGAAKALNDALFLLREHQGYPVHPDADFIRYGPDTTKQDIHEVPHAAGSNSGAPVIPTDSGYPSRWTI